jgi:2-keto-4-pentenoate hydratase
MPAVDPRLVEALHDQLRHRDAALISGARHVGWKLGMGCRERIGSHIAVGYLTSQTVLAAHGRYTVLSTSDPDLHVDAELWVELSGDLDASADRNAAIAAIARCGAALEIVDLAQLAGEPESVVADNVFHRAVAFAETPVPMSASLPASVYVNGELRDRDSCPNNIPDRLADAAKILAAVDQCLRAGDRIITGSIVQLPIGIGDRVSADFGDHATLAVEIHADER